MGHRGLAMGFWAGPLSILFFLYKSISSFFWVQNQNGLFLSLVLLRHEQTQVHPGDDPPTILGTHEFENTALVVPFSVAVIT
jgi:hypothetical protein